MKKTLIQWLGLLGVLSLLSYTAAVVFSPLAYPGYNWMAQAVSDLMADNSPSKMLWNQLSSLYGASCTGFPVQAMGCSLFQIVVMPELFKILCTPML